MRQLIFMIFPLALLLTAPLQHFQATAQDQADPAGLTVEDVAITIEIDAFGQPVTLATGRLINEDTATAYTQINIFADALDASGAVIGEGFGFPVNACGIGLLPDFALQPGAVQLFRVELEVFQPGVEVASVELFPEATPTDPAPRDLSRPFIGLSGITRGEVVNVEWIDEETLRYGVGCDATIFTRLDWYNYDLESGESLRTLHPSAPNVTDALLTQLDLMEPEDYNRSFLTFPQGNRRIIYQTDINVMLTAEPDGSFKRLIYDDLSRRSLQGFIWLPDGRFLAYYYGAFGETVTYFTASLEGQRISRDIYNGVPSFTVPGPTPDGARAVISATIDDVTGYYLQQITFTGSELLFEAEPPGNNWPAPIYAVYEGEQAFVFIMRPVAGVPRLQCFDMQTRTLNDLTSLPLDLTTSERAWAFLSPSGTRIALAANGVNGGLWMIDLLELNGCNGPAAPSTDE